MSHYLKEAYDQAFKTFLRSTTEKTVLLKMLAGRVEGRATQTLLDIGAGNGDLAIPLSKLVRRYVAVEANERFAATLASAGLAVHHQTFPCEIAEEFDLVLMCHSAPFLPEKYDPFLDAAWKLVRPGGTLAVVTFDNVTSGWARFLAKVGLSLTSPPDRLEKLEDRLSQFGPIVIRSLQTAVVTKTAHEMMAALSFVFSDGKPEKYPAFMEKSAAILSALESEDYRREEGYSFSFDHYLYEVTK